MEGTVIFKDGFCLFCPPQAQLADRDQTHELGWLQVCRENTIPGGKKTESDTKSSH